MLQIVGLIGYAEIKFLICLNFQVIGATKEHILAAPFRGLRNLYDRPIESRRLNIKKARDIGAETLFPKQEIKLVQKCWSFPLFSSQGGRAIVPFLHIAG